MAERFTPSPRELATFMAVAAESSFSGAARRLGITQPSVSEQIRALELHFGQPLFERLGRETPLTAAGERLHGHVERLLLALEEMERDLQALKDGERGVLAIAASPVPGEAVLPALLPAFQAAHPGTSIREVIGDTRGVVERLMRREVELAVIGGPFHDERCLSEVVARDDFALIAPRDHPLAALPAVTAERLSQEPLVLREEGSGARVAVETAFAAAGIEPDRIRVVAELGTTEAVKAAVSAGLGVGFVSVCSLVAGGPAGVLRALPMADIAPARDLLLVTERGRPLSALARAFRDLLLSQEVRRSVRMNTRLPTPLRQGDAPSNRAAPRVGEPAEGTATRREELPHDDPLLESRPRGSLRVARPPRSADEERVGALLARPSVRTRAELVEALADDLRLGEGDPFGGVSEIGFWRLSLYSTAAEQTVNSLLGDFLEERSQQPGAKSP